MKYYIVHITLGYIYASFKTHNEAFTAFQSYVGMCLEEENPVECRIVESNATPIPYRDTKVMILPHSDLPPSALVWAN